MTAKKQMGRKQPGAVLVDSGHGGTLNEAAGCRVAFLLLAKSQAHERTQTIRFQSQDRVAPGEKKNLFRPRLPNPRKFLQSFLRL
jgi:hypothetical protein